MVNYVTWQVTRLSATLVNGVLTHHFFIQTVQIWSLYLHNEMCYSARHYPTSAVNAPRLFKLAHGFQIIRSPFYTFERSTSFSSTIIYQQR